MRPDDCTIDQGDRRRLEAVGSEIDVARGRLLIERGQPGSGLYVVLDGVVVVEAPEGIRALGPGTCLGERALFSADGTRTARVFAATDARVLAVPRPAVERLCAHDPALAERLARSS